MNRGGLGKDGEDRCSATEMRIKTDSMITGLVWGIAGILFWLSSSAFRQLFSDIIGPTKEHPFLTSAVLSVPSVAWLIIFVFVGLCVVLKDLYLTNEQKPLNWPFVLGLFVLSVVLLIGFLQPLFIIHLHIGK